MDPEKHVRDGVASARGRRRAGTVRSVTTLAGRVARALGAGAFLVAASPAAPAENLVEVFRLALTSDPEFLAAGAIHRAALEARPQARADLLPNASVSVARLWNDTQQRPIFDPTTPPSKSRSRSTAAIGVSPLPRPTAGSRGPTRSTPPHARISWCGWPSGTSGCWRPRTSSASHGQPWRRSSSSSRRVGNGSRSD